MAETRQVIEEKFKQFNRQYTTFVLRFPQNQLVKLSRTNDIRMRDLIQSQVSQSMIASQNRGLPNQFPNPLAFAALQLNNPPYLPTTPAEYDLLRLSIIESMLLAQRMIHYSKLRTEINTLITNYLEQIKNIQFEAKQEYNQQEILMYFQNPNVQRLEIPEDPQLKSSQELFKQYIDLQLYYNQQRETQREQNRTVAQNQLTRNLTVRSL